MAGYRIRKTRDHIILGTLRVEKGSEHVERRTRTGWKHLGSVQAVRDNPRDFNLSPQQIRHIDALWGSL